METSENKKQAIRSLMSDVTDQTFSDYIQLRNAKKAPLTARALEGIRKESEKAGITLETALIECCTRGWAGFKAEWYQRISVPNQMASPITQIDRVAYNKQQTELAKQKLFGNQIFEKDVTNG